MLIILKGTYHLVITALVWYVIAQFVFLFNPSEFGIEVVLIIIEIREVSDKPFKQLSFSSLKIESFAVSFKILLSFGKS